MKISNTEAAIRKIQERALFIERRNAIRDNEWRVSLTNDNLTTYSHDVTEAVDVNAIKEAAIRLINKKLADNAVELKELGVYIDSEECAIPSIRHVRI